MTATSERSGKRFIVAKQQQQQQQPPQQPQPQPQPQQPQQQTPPWNSDGPPVNLEFLRNIVLGYIEKTGDRSRLLPVLAELLQFSESDVLRVQQRSAGWAGTLGWR